MPADWTARGLADRLLAPGGAEPDWGPADVNLAQKPSPPAAAARAARRQGGGQEGGPRAGQGQAHARRSSVLARAPGCASRLAGPAKLALIVTRASGKAVKGSIRTAGKPGANTLRFKGRIGGHALRPAATA